MNRRTASRVWLLLLTIACLGLSGCSQPIPPALLAVRERLLLEQEPQGATTIEQARKQLADDTDHADVTLVVKIGNRHFTNWSAEKQSTFYVSEGFPGSDYNIGPDHDPSTCPFCKWKWKEEDSFAVVEVANEAGDVLPHSAETILDLTPGRTLTIHGNAKTNESGILLVRLSGLYVHPQ